MTTRTKAQQHARLVLLLTATIVDAVYDTPDEPLVKLTREYTNLVTALTKGFNMLESYKTVQPLETLVLKTQRLAELVYDEPKDDWFSTLREEAEKITAARKEADTRKGLGVRQLKLRGF